MKKAALLLSYTGDFGIFLKRGDRNRIGETPGKICSIYKLSSVW